MKTRKFTLLFCFMLCACFLSARASSFGDIRVNARFLTDRMAFELNLNQSQYNDLFEINFDFLSGVDPYLTGMACADAAALDAYYRYLDERNDDLRWVLSSSAYARFLAIEYFFRPIYALNNVCYLRVYKVYPNRNFFYFGRPVHYLTYRGAHSRRFYRNTGFYRTHYAGRYQHPVYRGNFHSRPEFRKHDFIVPRPAKNPGYHFTPVGPSKPGTPAHRPEARPPYRPGSSVRPTPKPAPKPEKRPSRVDNKRPVQPGNSRPARPGFSRPADKAPNRVTRPSKSEHKVNRRPVRPNGKERGKQVKQTKEKSFLHKM